MRTGTTFYYVDISHCFWRIAYLKGYITKRLYESVLKQPELKTARNIALACIVASKWRKYVVNGVFRCEITEDRTLQRVIYDNIRFTCYNTMGMIASFIEKNCIAYRTDGIMVDKVGLPKVKKLIRAQNFEYTVQECVKIDEVTYLSAGRTKNI